MMTDPSLQIDYSKQLSEESAPLEPQPCPSGKTISGKQQCEGNNHIGETRHAGAVILRLH